MAVLDQEEAKKFLCGKPEDKYEFFSKATELERLDRQYASIFDKIEEMSESRAKVEKSLLPKKEIVEQLKKEWEQFEILEKMEEKIEIFRVKYAWRLYWEFKEKEDEATKVRIIVIIFLIVCINILFLNFKCSFLTLILPCNSTLHSLTKNSVKNVKT